MAQRSRARCASCRSATATSASTSRRTPTSPPRCARRSRKIKAEPEPPAFVLHTGDLTHLSKAGGVRHAAADRCPSCRCRCSTCPASTTCSKTTAGATWSDSARARGRRLAQLRPWRRALHRPGQRREPQGGRPGLARRRAARVAGEGRRSASRAARRSSSSRTFRSGRSIRSGDGAPTTASRRSSYLKRFGSVSVLNGHIHQVMQKVEGHVTFHTAMSTAFPQPAPGTAPSPGPMKVADDRLRKVLGLSRMSFHGVNHPIAITDLPLEADSAAAGAHDVADRQLQLRARRPTSVPVGTTVTWTNRDDIPHNVVSTEQRFKSPVLDTDGRFSHRFDTPAPTSTSARFIRG